jgi:hypothetical protein
MFGVLTFAAGAGFVYFVLSKQYIWAIIMILLAILFIAAEQKTLNGYVKDDIIRKLTYVYSLIQYTESATVQKEMRKVLEELALDTCGMSMWSTWVKWLSYNQNKWKEKE